MYDSKILSNLASSETLDKKYSFIAKVRNEVKLLRSYYIKVKVGKVETLRRIVIDVSTGEELAENELTNLYS
ncbi:hypothetical protein [Gemella cuniculi]|uniref:hypothetical protein n=1 Tax=Gemella cuniculi TaxID=150240 RepID=UPI000403165C|nr:hypothetical protein [Gemella cuniculi]